MCKGGSKNRFLTIGLILILSLFAFSSFVEAQSWPGVGSWIYLGSDDNEDGTSDNFRDVQNIYYYSDSSYLYLRLCCRDVPTFTKTSPPREARYKWFIDLDNNSYISGGNVVEAEYLLFSEDTNDVLPGEVYLLNDTNGDGSFAEWNGSYSGGLVTNPAVAAYRIDSACFDQYIAWSSIGNAANVWLIWSTDQENPNLDQSPSADSPDSGVTVPIGPITHSYCTDNDGDTYAVQGGVCGPVDCNDADNAVYPGATEICDNKNNDCNAGTPDGSGEAWIGTPCDGADTDLCNEGTYSCTSGVQSCSDNTGNNMEICDGLNNDCNPATADGSGEVWYGTACDGADTDLCNEGSYSCTSGAQACSDNTGNNVETCDGLNNDCNPATTDGSGEAWIGTPCDGPDTDLCNEGTYSCISGVQSCSDNTGSTVDLCDGLNNDCNPATADGSGESWYGTACDGLDTDLCKEGTYGCTGGAQSCSDATGNTAEVCNDTLDNDCDTATDCADTDCTGNPACQTVSYYCDNDSDTYKDTSVDGTCAGAGCQPAGCQTTPGNDCNDTDAAIHPGATEICDNKNNDCNAGTPDGSGEAWYGTTCDGPDTDLCKEGTYGCTGGAQVCSDATGNTVEVCTGGLDEDCDGAIDCNDSNCPPCPGETACFDSIDNDSDGKIDCADPDCAGKTNGACDGPDTDLCNEGVWTCSGGSKTCSDNTGNTVEVCTGTVDEDCDGLNNCADPNCASNPACIVACTDNDHDTYAVQGGACGPVDCNDSDSTVHPGAVESRCSDAEDNDCDGFTDSSDSDCNCPPAGCVVGGIIFPINKFMMISP